MPFTSKSPPSWGVVSSTTFDSVPVDAVNWPLLTVTPVPAIAVRKSTIDSFLLLLLSSASINPILSFWVLTAPADKLFKSVLPVELIVTLSAVAFVVIVTLVPATKVRVSVALSALH